MVIQVPSFNKNHICYIVNIVPLYRVTFIG